LVELLKVASFSYINFALVLVPFPLLVHFAGWNRGILFILSYITLYPITTFLNSIIAASNNFFPSWLSAIFKLFLRNSLPIIIGLFAVHHNMGKFVQGMLVGLIIHRLFLMLGLSITVAASRSKSIRVDEKNVRVAASFLYMAVIIMTLPSIFKLSSPDSGALGLLKISRWSAVFLFFLLLFSLVYSLRTESKFWSATEQMSGQLRIGPITAVVVLVLGLGITVISSWLFVVSSSWVTLNWGIGQTFIAGIMVPMALHAADFTVYAKLAFAGNIKPTTLDVVRASLEVCLFVAPVLIIAAWIGAKTVSLAFFGLVTISSILAIVNLGLLLSALKVTWLQGVMMTIGYLLITVGYFLQNEQTMG
jgi:Ca2+:H+ antiporter